MTFSIKHSMPGGDLLSLLPGLKQIYESTGKKCIIYQRVNLEYGDLYGCYVGAKYSIKNKEDIPVTMNTGLFNALSGLLLYQEYIEDFREWNGESVDYDMDLLRQIDTTMPYGAINRWSMYLWPEMTCDLSTPWLETYDNNIQLPVGRILVNRTERYNNMLISYNFLKKYGEDKLLFIGLPEENEVFRKVHKVDIPFWPINNLMDATRLMQKSKLFIGSQSMCFQIAEGLKIPRLLEVCKSIPNVIGSGPGFYDFLTQRALEYYVNKLFNE